jgi:uncharacterized protein
VASPWQSFSNSVPILLLPPSEGKARGGRRRGWEPRSGAFADLADRRATVISRLTDAAGGDQRLLGVSGDHLRRAQAANSSLIGAPTLPAWRRYTGVVWEHLDPATLTTAHRKRILVVSGLLGLARADDPVPDYRLKMGTSLPSLGKLSTWWRAPVTCEIAEASRRKVVVDLLPQEHRAAWDPTATPGVRALRISLVDPSGAPAGHFAKAAKGRLARSILLDGIDAIDGWIDERFVLDVTVLRAASEWTRAVTR